MEKSFGLMFFIRKPRWNVEGKLHDIYLKINVNGLPSEVSVKLQCDKAKWNAAAGRMIGQTDAAKAINNYLDVLQRKVYEHRKQLVDDGKPVTSANIKLLLQGREIDRPKHMLMDIFQKHNDQIKALVGREYAASTLERYKPLSGIRKITFFGNIMSRIWILKNLIMLL